VTASNVKVVHCSVRYFIEIHKLQTKLGVFEAEGKALILGHCVQLQNFRMLLAMGTLHPLLPAATVDISKLQLVEK